MKAAQSSLPLSAILLVGICQSALAGPQSLLDPYATVKAPTKKATPAGKKAAPERVIPQSVTIGGGSLPPLQRTKSTSGAPAAKGSVAPPRAAVPAGKPIASVAAPASDGDGFIAGTKQIFRGIGTATKGAVVNPAKKLAGGTKAMGSAVAGGAKSSGGIFATGASKVGGGFKAVGGGFMAVGGKIKEGTAAVGGKIVAAPKALMPGGKDEGQKIAEKQPVKKTTETAILDDKDKPVANAPLPKLSPIKNESASGSGAGGGLGSKLIGMPKSAIKGFAGAAAKTGESAKKVAAAPIGFFGKLNPFKHKEAVQTAATPKPQQIASPDTVTPIK